MADSIRKRIIENVRASLDAIGELAGCEYDKPFDATRQHLPFGWVYDMEEQYDLEAGVGVSVNTLSIGIIVAFRYSREEGMGEVANRLIPLIWDALMGTEARETRGGLGITTPVWMGFQDSTNAAWVGEIRARIEVQYEVNKRDMTAQTVATP